MNSQEFFNMFHAMAHHPFAAHVHAHGPGWAESGRVGCGPFGRGHAHGRAAWAGHGHAHDGQDRPDVAEFARSRGGGRGPFGPPFGGPPQPGFPPFGFGGPGGFGFRAGRKLSSKDLQLVLLALLGEKPRHGYDLIKAIEERSNGFYVPSPGVIYPALTYLEEAGEALSEAEGNRKLYRLTEAGDKRLDTQRKEVDRLLAQLEELGRGMDRVREAFSRAEDGEESEARGPWSTAPELFQVLHELRHVLAEQRGADHERRLEIIAALRRAIDEIRGARTPDTGR